jgi:hypothetical protein
MRQQSHASDPLDANSIQTAYTVYGLCGAAGCICLARRFSQAGNRKTGVGRSIACNAEFTFVLYDGEVAKEAAAG